MDKYKRLTEVVKIRGRRHDNLSRSLEDAESNKTIAEGCGVPESTLKKLLKARTVPTFLVASRLLLQMTKRNNQLIIAEIQLPDYVV